MLCERLSLTISSFTVSALLLTVPTFAQEIKTTSSILIAQQQEQKIQEGEVEELIKKADQAVNSQNVTEILTYFTPFSYSEVTLDTDTKTETLRINGLEEHRQYFQDSFAEIKDSEVLFDDYQISIVSDGAIAYIYRTRLVNYTMDDGQQIILASKTKARLAKLSGELKIISIQQDSEVDLRPQLLTE